MSITYKTFSTEVEYNEFLVELIARVEGREEEVYYIGNPDRKAHIGIGFNIEEDPARAAVILTLGINPDRIGLKAEQINAEIGYRNAIVSVLAPNVYNDEGLVQQALNSIMLERHNDVNNIYAGTNFNRKNTFTMTDAEMDDAFSRIRPVYEDRVRDWIGDDSIYAEFSRSKEMAAFVSLSYQGYVNKGKSPSLKRALINGDRAEAWYEIRYNTSAEARRFLEADIFGLYNPTVVIDDPSTMTEDEAMAAYRTRTRHRDHILIFEFQNKSRFRTAVSFGNDIGVKVYSVNEKVHLDESFRSAHLFLTERYADNSYIDGDIFIGEDSSTLYYNGSDSDVLTGTDKNDLILGESGDDVIEGGFGNDILRGGLGNDTYIYSSLEGQDTIIDFDGLGSIEWNGITLTGGESTTWFKLDPPVTFLSTITPVIYLSADKQFRYFYQPEKQLLEIKKINFDQTTGAITEEKGSILVREFDDPTGTVLGINLTEQAEPTFTQTLDGDQSPDGDVNDFMVGNPDENDKFYGLTGDDDLYGDSGDDFLSGGSGNDWLFGEDGNDALLGGSENDFMQGGAGRDLFEGGDGDDIMEDDYLDAPREQGNEDLIIGGDGQDLIIPAHSGWEKPIMSTQRASA